MVITSDLIRSIFLNLMLGYEKAYGVTATWWDVVGSQIPSSTRENRYAWTRLIPRLREWIGERQLVNLEAAGYSIINKRFERTIEVDRDDVEDDNLGVYSQWSSSLGRQAKKWPDDLFVKCFQDGVNALAFDGQPFFDTSHPTGQPGSSDVYANLYTNKPLNSTNYALLRSYMQLFPGEDGKPLGVTPNLLVVDPSNEEAGRKILNAEMIPQVFGSNTAAAGVTNVYKGSADLLVVSELGGEPGVWYLLDTNKPIRPFVFQLRKPPTFVNITEPTSENVFMRNKFLAGVDARGNAGYSLPFLAVRAEPS